VSDLSRYEGRHSSTQHHMRWLQPNRKLDGVALDVAQIYWLTAQSLADILGDGPELSEALRELRRSKDCAVIQALEDANRRPGSPW
jgi:hypothetical protein